MNRILSRLSALKLSERNFVASAVDSKNDLILSVAALENADYSKNPDLGNIYQRLSNGRVQFEEAFSNDIQAVMEISSLELSLKHHANNMSALSNNVADATSVISDAASESSAIAGQVNEQHEELTNTIKHLYRQD